MVDDLDIAVFGVLLGIREVMSADNLTDAEKVAATVALFDQGQTEDFDMLKDNLVTTASDAV